MRPSSQIPFLMSLLPFPDIQSWLSSVIVLHLLSIEKEGEEGGGSKKRNGGHEGERRGIKEGCGWGEEWEGGKHTILPLAQVSNFSFTESHCWSQGVRRL